MNYDEIDQYVDQLFNQPEDKPEVISGDWRIDRIDEIIEDAYNEAIWWHNSRIADGCDPRSGLRGLKYVPWDERIDGVAAMQGACASGEASYARNGQAVTSTQPAKRNGLTCGEAALIVAIVAGLLLFMAVWA